MAKKIKINEYLDGEYYNPYCETCGTCGYIGCCGIRNFIDEHIKGKTNCKNEDIIINELIDLCEYKDEVFEENKQLKEENKQLKIENAYYKSKILGGNSQLQELNGKIEILGDKE